MTFYQVRFLKGKVKISCASVLNQQLLCDYGVFYARYDILSLDL